MTMLLVAFLVAACQDGAPASDVNAPEPTPQTTAAPLRSRINPRLLRRFKSIAVTQDVPASNAAEVALGRMLWFDGRLSKGGGVSCNDCHQLSAYGVDGKSTSTGVTAQVGRRNAPTVYNAALHFAMFWDGRERNVEEQATKPILNPVEMGMTEEAVLEKLRGIPGYVTAFQHAFPDDKNPIALANVGRALGAFERGLTTRSRWDDYLAGKEDALDDAEIEGLRVFLNVGCMACHTGPQVGASMFQVVGSVEPWPNQDDLGRYEITHLPSDRMVFKVPSLKNIARTAPYFHDGSAKTLPEAVERMGRHQLGIELSTDEIASIVTFLQALTGDLPTAYIAEPQLPPGPRTRP